MVFNVSVSEQTARFHGEYINRYKTNTFDPGKYNINMFQLLL